MVGLVDFVNQQHTAFFGLECFEQRPGFEEVFRKEDIAKFMQLID